MDYDKIILELLDRIKALEEKVSLLEKSNNTQNVSPSNINPEKELSLVDRTKNYIQECKKKASDEGEEYIILVSGGIQKALGVSNRVPSICNAMRDCMQINDIVLEEPPSGFSTRLTIQYFLNQMQFFKKEDEYTMAYNIDSSALLDKTISLRQLQTGFKSYFNEKKPNYSHPDPLFGMAFYITRHNLGITLEQLFSKEISLDEYGDILYNHFYEMKPSTAKNRTSAYKDAMKNLLEYVDDMHYENVKISK